MALKILLADGDSLHQDTLAEGLNASGHAVVGVADGLQAVKQIRQADFDMVVLDLDLPVLGVVAAIRIIRSQFAPKDQPKVVVTTTDETQAILRLAGEEVEGLLVKPVSSSQLAEMLRVFFPGSSSPVAEISVAPPQDDNHFQPFQFEVERQVTEARIYLIDDEERNIRLLERLLLKHGYRNVVGTTDPRVLKSIVEKELPDLLLLDLNMPEMGGLELLQSLSSLQRAVPAVPVLVLTGDMRPEVRRAALQQGVRDFINKPFDPLEVLCRIRNLVESRVISSLMFRQNRTLGQQVEDHVGRYAESQTAWTRCLTLTSGYRGDPSGLQARRVGQAAVLLAQRAGVSTTMCDLLALAAPLRDVGMVAIPDAIVNKPGPLDTMEWDSVKTHPLVGARILQNLQGELGDLAQQLALSHHERWDGTGYPYGSKGLAIPALARIVGLCDAFIAMLGDRSYRRAHAVESAVLQIQGGAGSHFDPDLVEKFLEVLPALLTSAEEI
jgi:putative two-component system response regulator